MNVGELQRCGLEIYVFDPIFDEPDDEDDPFPFPGTLEGSRLTVRDLDRASRCLTAAQNSADEDGDPKVRDALWKLQRRLRSSTS